MRDLPQLEANTHKMFISWITGHIKTDTETYIEFLFFYFLVFHRRLIVFIGLLYFILIHRVSVHFIFIWLSVCLVVWWLFTLIWIDSSITRSLPGFSLIYRHWTQKFTLQLMAAKGKAYSCGYKHSPLGGSVVTFAVKMLSCSPIALMLTL